jgi:hypothetical protein
MVTKKTNTIGKTPTLAPKRKTTTEDTLGISVKIIKENKDGSADAQVTFSKEGLETLVQWGIVALLTAAVDEYRVRPDEGSKTVTKRTRPTTTKTKPVAKKTKK